MMKVLHSADWHMDAPLRSLPPRQAAVLREHMLELPGRVAGLCREQGCDIMLLAGDIFDGPYTPASLNAVRQALEDAAVPVFVAPGNHDCFRPGSPWQKEYWPGNVHIFKRNEMESVVLEALSCRVYGAAFTGTQSASLLRGFQAGGQERYAVAVLHGDPVSARSVYCPVTAGQVRESGLDYLALGHIHEGGSFTAGATLAAWPGCAAGRGFDETGVKGALIVTLQDRARAEFVPLGGPAFYEFQAEAGTDPVGAALRVLPAGDSQDFFRVCFTGEAEPVDLEAVRSALARYPNLILRDQTRAPMELWANADEDTLEGTYFRILRDAAAGQDDDTVRALELAAKLSRRILRAEEVELP